MKHIHSTLFPRFNILPILHEKRKEHRSGAVAPGVAATVYPEKHQRATNHQTTLCEFGMKCSSPTWKKALIWHLCRQLKRSEYIWEIRFVPEKVFQDSSPSFSQFAY